eukprot:7727463-Ditylum_brightwellii.AAC.1
MARYLGMSLFLVAAARQCAAFAPSSVRAFSRRSVSPLMASDSDFDDFTSKVSTTKFSIRQGNCFVWFPV